MTTHPHNAATPRRIRQNAYTIARDDARSLYISTSRRALLIEWDRQRAAGEPWAWGRRDASAAVVCLGPVRLTAGRA
jgi:hypothetical protein